MIMKRKKNSKKINLNDGPNILRKCMLRKQMINLYIKERKHLRIDNKWRTTKNREEIPEMSKAKLREHRIMAEMMQAGREKLEGSTDNSKSMQSRNHTH